MKKETTHYRYIVLALLALCAVSLYRRLSLAYLPQDPLRPYIVSFVYIFLLGSWLYSLTQRITQRFMLRCLWVECIVMIFWLTVRLLQETVLYRDILLMRVSGYFIVFPLLITLLYGVYAAFGLGMSESYRIPRRMYLLLIPDLMLVGLMLTNEQHHIVFRVLPGEDTNLAFHTNVGFVIILLFATFLIVSRLMIILRRTRSLKAGRIKRLLPLFIGLGIPVVIIPYLMKSFLPVPEFELIELTAMLYFLEAMIWESCIFLGLVPVNTRYGMVFEQSTVGMRITDPEGSTLLKSSLAKELSKSELARLTEKGSIRQGADFILHSHSISHGYLIYQQDVSNINGLISEREQMYRELKQENTLLSRELASRSAKATVEAQNQIYNQLSNEVGDCLCLMEKMLDGAGSEVSEELMKKLYITGTYLKRRCNLRLIEAANGSIDPEELRLSLEDMVLCLETCGIRAGLSWQPPEVCSGTASVGLLDLIEKTLERYDYSMTGLDIKVGDAVTLTVHTAGGEKTEIMPEEG